MRNENADNERKKHHRGRRRKKKGNIIANVILVIALIVFCVSGFQLFKIGKGYLDGRSEYDKVRKLAVTDDKNKNDKDHSEDGDDTFSVDFQKLLAVNRPYGKSDYIPCICWGRNARFASAFEVGEHVQVMGRIQSREYMKKITETESQKRVAYEVSVSKLECMDE